MKYFYFIAFVLQIGRAFEFGNCEVVRGTPILSIAAIDEVTSILLTGREEGTHVTIIDYKLLRFE